MENLFCCSIASDFEYRLPFEITDAGLEAAFRERFLRDLNSAIDRLRDMKLEFIPLEPDDPDITEKVYYVRWLDTPETIVESQIADALRAEDLPNN